MVCKLLPRQVRLGGIILRIEGEADAIELIALAKALVDLSQLRPLSRLR